MKKNKIIIPAMAMILFSTAASISGTVAWFTANRVFETKISNFSVVEIDGNLEATMAAGQGTRLEDGAKAVHVWDDRDYDLATATAGNPNTFVLADTAPTTDLVTGDLWYNGTRMKKYNSSADEEHKWADDATLTSGKHYICSNNGRFYVATSATAVSPVENNPAVLTHGSVAHKGVNEGHAFIIGDSEDILIDKWVDESNNWLYKKDITIQNTNEPTPSNETIDVYVAVSWSITFTYTFASDASDIGIYLDLAKSEFSDGTPDPKFTKTGTKGETKKGFRIGFYGPTDEETVWGNHEPISATDLAAADVYANPGSYTADTSIVYHDGAFYKCGGANVTNEAFDAAKWTQLNCALASDEYSDAKDYVKGDVVTHDNKTYWCSDGVSAEDWNTNKGSFKEVKSALTYVSATLKGSDIKEIHSVSNPYKAGDLVIHTDNKVYRCKADIAPHAFAPAEWDEVTKPIVAEDYDAGNTYEVGDVVIEDSKQYWCKTKVDTPAAWGTNSAKFEQVLNAAADDTDEDVLPYSKKDYVIHDSKYQRIENNVETAAAGSPERICVLKKGYRDGEDVGGNTGVMTIKCAAWFEGTDPNVVTGAAMDCLKADMVFYSRTLRA